MTDPKPGCAASVARFAAYFLAALFVLVMPLGVFLHSAGSILFSADAMASIVNENLVTTGKLQRLVVEAMVVQGGGGLTGIQGGDGGDPSEGPGTGAEFLSYLSEEERGRIVAILLEPGWTEAQIDVLVSGFYAWIDSQDATPQLTLDVSPLRARLEAGGLDEIVGILVESWPACTADQLAEMGTSRAARDEVPYLVCQPPEPMRSELTTYVHSNFGAELDRLPADGKIAPFGRGTNTPEPQAARLRGLLLALRAITAWGWLVPSSLLGLILALAVRSRASWGRWWGFPLFLAGLLSAGVILLADRQGFALLNAALPQMQAPAQFRDLVPGVLATLREQMIGRVFLEAAILASLGAVLVLTSARRGSRVPRAVSVRGVKKGGTQPEPRNDTESPSGMFG